MSEIGIIFNELIRSNKEQRLNTKGLIEMRVDMIVMAALLTRFVLKKLKSSPTALLKLNLKLEN